MQISFPYVPSGKVVYVVNFFDQCGQQSQELVRGSLEGSQNMVVALKLKLPRGTNKGKINAEVFNGGIGYRSGALDVSQGECK